MRKSRFGFVFLLLLLGAGNAGATLWYLPGAAEAPGANQSRFSSTLFVVNPGAQPANATVNFIPFPGGRTPEFPRAITIPAGDTLKYERVLETLFGLTNDVGTITVDSAQPLLLSLVTANIANPSGTFGQAIDPMRESDLFTGGADLFHVIWASHNGENFSIGYRTNVGGLLADPNSAVEIRVYDQNSILRGSTTVTNPTPASFQLSLTNIIGPTNLPLGRIEFDVRQGRAVLWASIVDNLTSDGIALIPQRPVTGSIDLTVNGAARTPGVNGTYWGTDVRLFNPSTIPITVNIAGLGFPTAGAIISRDVPARGVIELADVLGPGGFNFPEGYNGALRLSSMFPFLAAARTKNSGTSAGTFSGYQKPVPFTGGFMQTGARNSLVGLENNARFRTNIGFLAGPSGGIANLTLRDETGGSLATRRLVMENREWRQFAIQSLFTSATIPSLFRVDMVMESGALDAYASKIDNGTGDPVIVTPVALP
jgi:hypothetical protein